MTEQIPFNRPPSAANTLRYLKEVLNGPQLSANGSMTRACEQRLAEVIGSPCMLMHSGTAALEAMIILADIGDGDEVIMPSFTFSSTANAVALRGGVPVFVDIEPRTLNLDPAAAEAAVSDRTRAIMPIHYGGVACDIPAIEQLAAANDLLILSDAAHTIGSRVGGREIASWGQLSALSFHETKNLSSGEGGALVVNDPSYWARAEIVRDKGTNRSAFIQGLVDKYSWVDIGSSYGPGEIVAAMLLAQLDDMDRIALCRTTCWQRYHAAFSEAEANGLLRRPIVPEDQKNNGHIYYLLMDSQVDRDNMLAALNAEGICSVFHYVPLHSSPAGLRYGRTVGSMHVTDSVSRRLLRLPLFADLSTSDQDRVIDAVLRHLAT